MKERMSKRVAGRIERLKNRYRITGTRREDVPVREFFLGEIWWADREALGDQRTHARRGTRLPALVTRHQTSTYAPVEMARSDPCPPDDINELCFRPEPCPDALREGTVFLLPYRRPVARDDIGSKLATINSGDKQRLAELLAYLRTAE